MESSLRSSSSMIITPVRETEKRGVEAGHHPLQVHENEAGGLEFTVPSSTINEAVSSRNGPRSSRPGSPLNPGILPWDRFKNWVYCICVVTFDIEIGQAIEIVYPQHVKLTEREVSVR